MLVNSSLTIYRKSFDEQKRIETWTRYNYGEKEIPKVWIHGGKGASTNKGYENANDIKVRIPYDINTDLDITDFKIGDILVPCYLDFDITTSNDLKEYTTYNIISITNNTLGNNKHIHIEGK